MKIQTWEQSIEQGMMSQLSEVEAQCWAPWLAASPDSMESRAHIFSEGQLTVVDDSAVLATLSTNKIDWDGTSQLPSWDAVAGDPTDYSQTYRPDGNTLVFMSMNVLPSSRGLRLPQLLIEEAIKLCSENGLEHCIGSFRPSGYGALVRDMHNAGNTLTFSEYINMTHHNGEPIDPWLRVLSKFGMSPISIDYQAMVVPMSKTEVESYKGEEWEEITTQDHGGGAVEALWCGETGFIYRSGQEDYTYKEANLWGEIPIHQ